MTPGYSLPRTRALGTAFGLELEEKWMSAAQTGSFPSPVWVGTCLLWVKSGVKSGHVGKCGSACVWAVEEPEGGYAVASRC